MRKRLACISILALIVVLVPSTAFADPVILKDIVFARNGYELFMSANMTVRGQRAVTVAVENARIAAYYTCTSPDNGTPERFTGRAQFLYAGQSGELGKGTAQLYVYLSNDQDPLFPSYQPCPNSSWTVTWDDFYLESGRVFVLDEGKVLVELTLYGLPMLNVGPPGGTP